MCYEAKKYGAQEEEGGETERKEENKMGIKSKERK